MDVYICKLRKHLEKDNRINLVYIHGRGYNHCPSKKNSIILINKDDTLLT